MKDKIKNNEFLKRLFDFSFKKFITTRVVKFIFWINVILAGILGVLTIIGGFKESIGLGIIAVILAPIFYIIYVAILRVTLEVITVVFRIGEDVEEISHHLSGMKRVNDYEVKTEDKE
jgi:hypothetical protein